ncbi:MAG: hypothetical protein AB1782_15205 [Cyanobacteriota bacterium]
MKKDIILNPSCSELVTFLGIISPEEVRQVLIDICNKFDYRVKLIPSAFDPLNNPGIAIDITRLGVSRDVKVITYGGLLIDPFNTNLDKAFNERLISYAYYNKHKADQQKLRNLVSFVSNITIDKDQIIKMVLIDRCNAYVEIQFQACNGYNDTVGLSLQASESSSVSEFPLLGNVYLLNPAKYKYMTFEDGSTSDFEQWLRYRISHTDKEAEEWLKKKNYEEYYIKDFSFEPDEN